LAITDAFLDQKRVTRDKDVIHVSDFERCHQGISRQEAGKDGRLEVRLNGDYLRLIPGLCLEDRTN
jgi:hypothetical protein